MIEEGIGAVCSTVKAHKILLGKSEGIRSPRIPGAGEKVILKRFLLDLSNSVNDLVVGPLKWSFIFRKIG